MAIGSQKQLLVDDYIVSSMSNLTRVLGQVTKENAGKPVLVSDQPWENGPTWLYGTVLHDGQKFRAWYRMGDSSLAYAESVDGLRWSKPPLGLINFSGSTQNNLVSTSLGESFSAFLDSHESDLTRQYKAGYAAGKSAGLAYSADGIQWTLYNNGQPVTTPASDSYNQLVWDPGANVYRLIVRHNFAANNQPEDRGTRFMTNPDVNGSPINWTTLATFAFPDFTVKQTYSLTDWIYEGVHFALIMLYEYPDDLSEGPYDLVHKHQRDVLDYYIATSRDGLSWDFTWINAGQPLVPRGPDGSFDKDWAFPTSQIITYQDRHWLYYAGAKERHDMIQEATADNFPGIGLATLRLDGFVGLKAQSLPGYVVTQPFLVPGAVLETNVDASGGSVAVEVLDQNGNPIPGYTLANAVVQNGANSVRFHPSWTGHADLASLVGTPVLLKFYLTNATLYSFKFPDQAANPPPIISITSPASPFSVAPGSNIALAATATDNGTIAKVEFFKDLVKLGDGTLGAGGTYNFTWQNAPIGSYIITARATDNLGLFANSLPLYVTVAPAPAIASVMALDPPTVVSVTFSEPVQEASAETLSNYTISNGITITAAALSSDGKTLALTTSSLSTAVSYTLTVNNIQSLSGLPIASNSTWIFGYGQVVPQGLRLWLRADAGTVATGPLVSQWLDQSGGGVSAIQPNIANQPSLVPGVIKGMPVLRFNGTSSFLSFILNLNGLSGMTVFLVNSNAADLDGTAGGAANAPLFWNETQDWSSTHFSPFQRYVKFRFGTGQGGNEPTYTRPASIGTAPTLTTVIKDGATETLFVSGQLALTQTGKLPTAEGVRALGNVGRGYNDNTYYAGDIAELIVYNRPLSDGERQIVEQYLTNKYFVVSLGPIISGVAVTGITSSTATVSWTTNVASDSRVQYGTTTTYELPAITNPAQVANHSIGLTGLLPGTSYHYHVLSADAAGNLNASGDFTFLTKPPAPIGFAAQPANGQVSLSWSASPGATAYNVKRATTAGGPYTVIATNVPLTGYFNPGLINGTTYYYVVSALNSTGESANSLEVSAQPLASLSSNSSFLSTFSTSTLRNDFSGWVGMKITVGINPLTITSAGRMCAPGNSQTHVVKFVAAAGGADVPGGSLSIGMSGCVAGQFMYRPFVSPITLVAGASYYLASSELAGGDRWYDYGPVTTQPVATMSAIFSSDGTGWFLPPNPANTSYVPLDFRYLQPVPAAPAALLATPGNAQVTLTWATVAGAASFSVKRGNSDGGPYTTIATNVTVNTYLDTGLLNGTTYFYVVSGINANGEGLNSPQASVQPAPPPSGNGSVSSQGLSLWLKADAGITLNRTQVAQWSDQSGSGVAATQAVASLQPTLVQGAIHGNPVLRFDGISTFLTFPLNINTWTGMTMIMVNANVGDYDGTWTGTTNSPLFWNELGSWSSTHFSPFQRYVKFRFGTGQSSNLPIYTRPVPIGTAPTLTTVIKNGTTETLYVERQLVYSQGGMLSTIGGVQSTASIGRGFDNNTYYGGDIAEILIYNRALSDSERQQAELYLYNKYFALGPVLSSIGASSIGSSSATITWATDAPADGQVGYGTTSTYGQMSTLVNTLSTAHSVVLSGLSPGSQYHYQAISRGGNGVSTASDDFAFLTVPDVPVGLTATPGNARASLNWLTVTGATAYKVKRATTAGGPYSTITSNLAAPPFSDTGLTNGTTYFYVVSALNGTGEGGNSAEVSAQPLPPPAAPTGLLATPGNAQVSLTWTPANGATGYNVKQATTSGGPYSTIASNFAGSTYLNTALTNRTTYFYVVSALNGGGEGLNSSEVGAKPVAPPVAPGGLTATPGNSQVSLSWSAVTDATGYNVKQATASGGPYTTIAPNVTATTYVNMNLTNGATYFYIVSGLNTSGQGPNSAEVNGQPVPPPPAPSGLAATPGNGQVSLNWTASSGATSFNVKRATVTGGPYTVIATLVATPTYVDMGLTNGSTYFYVVSGANGSGEGANSIQASAQPVAPPLAPSGLQAIPANGQISLAWTAVSSATGYNVKRAAVAGGPYVAIATNVPSPAYVNTGLTNGTSYFYVVSGVNAGGEGPNSAEVNARPIPAPAAPTGLLATPGNGQVSLTWTAVNGATSYNVKRAAVTGGPYVAVATNVAVTAFLNVGLANGTTYFYVVSAVNGSGESANSSEVSSQPVAPPASPTGLVATPGNGQISLTWTVIAGVSSYNVKRSTISGGSYTAIATVSTPVYVNTGLSNGTTYFYVVSAVNTGGEGPNSTQAGAQPIAPPLAPSGLRVAPSNGQVSLSWTAAVGAVSYNVKRGTTTGGPYTTIANLPAPTFVNTPLTNGTTYFYVVSGLNSSGEGPNSSESSATPSAASSQFITSFTSNVLRNDFSGWVGMKLTIGTSPLTALSVGRMCAPGNAGTHSVKFVNASTGVDVPGGSALLNMSGCTVGQFVYGTLVSPITLGLAGNYYLASSEVLGGDRWYDYTAPTTTSDAAISAIYSLNGTAWLAPPSSANTTYVPVNFTYSGGLDVTGAFLTGFSSNVLRNDFSGWLGMKLTVGAAAKTVSSLGRFCAAGNTGTHIVRLVNAATGAGVVGGSATLNMSGCTVGQFFYNSLPNTITLPAGSSYYLASQEVAGGDRWYDYAAVTTPGATVLSVYSSNGTAWLNPPAPANTSYVPLNFK